MSSLIRSISITNRERPSSQEVSVAPDDTGLAKVNSRLVPANPAFTQAAPQGILLNALRPYNSNSASSSQASLNDPRSSSHHDVRNLSSSPSTRNPHNPPYLKDELESRGRSSSRDSSAKDGSGRKIRFAPLPEIRQRSYSTGRNVWFDKDDPDAPTDRGADSMGIVVRRDGEDFGVFDDEDSDVSDDEDLNSKGIFGSWQGGSFGRRSDKENEASYTSKLLKPLSFGRKKEKSGGRTRRDSDALARVSSVDSDVSRGSSEASRIALSVQGRPIGGTGIPMRKTQTWELGETPVSQSRRANYPPVAQRSRRAGNRGSTLSVSAPDPTFVEWGFSGSGGGAARPSAAKARSVDEDDDDGSGMAWVKRRRAEKEAAEREAAEKKAQEEAETAAASGGVPTESAPGSGTATPTAIPSQPKSSSLATTATTSPPKVGGLSATKPSSSTPVDLSAAAYPAADPIKSQPVAIAGAVDSSEPDSRNRPTSDSSTLSSDDDKNDDDDDDNDDNDDDDDDDDNNDDDADLDSDLDAAELEEEEELAAKARATAISAGAERFHTADHHSRMLKVDGKK